MTDTPAETLYCANHPQVETSLRCNRCGKPICARCALRTPVGYRCRECVRTQQQVFETAVWLDYVIAAVVTAPLAGLGAFLLSNLGFFMFFLAPVAGGVIAEIVRVAVRRRRGRYLSLVAVGAFVLGCLPLLLLPVLLAAFSLFAGRGEGILSSLFGSLFPLIYTVLGASTLYARLRGISVG